MRYDSSNPREKDLANKLMQDYAKAYTRLSLLGVNNINDLKECTKVLPAERPTFVSEDQVLLDRWLAGEFDQLNNLVDDAIQLTGVISSKDKKA